MGTLAEEVEDSVGSAAGSSAVWAFAGLVGGDTGLILERALCMEFAEREREEAVARELEERLCFGDGEASFKSDKSPVIDPV